MPPSVAPSSTTSISSRHGHQLFRTRPSRYGPNSTRAAISSRMAPSLPTATSSTLHSPSIIRIPPQRPQRTWSRTRHSRPSGTGFPRKTFRGHGTRAVGTTHSLDTRIRCSSSTTSRSHFSLTMPTVPRRKRSICWTKQISSRPRIPERFQPSRSSSHSAR